MKNFGRWIQNKRIAVLYGGWSEEAPISRKTGAAVLKAFRERNVSAVGIEMNSSVAEKIRKSRADFCFIALHGKWGEDGTAQGLCELLKIPYSGSGVLASALSMNKSVSKTVFQKHGIPTPPFRVTRSWPVSFSLPAVIKPVDGGSAIGVTVAHKREEVKSAFQTAIKYSQEVLLEKFVKGKEITAAVLGDRALPLIEILPKHAFYDYTSKYVQGMSRHILPARIPAKVAQQVSEIALKAHAALGCRAFSRVDFIVDGNGSPWVLELNSIPGLTETSLFPEAARAAGFSFSEMIFEMVRCSLNPKQ
ncbi:MAG: D-alanine--D-alanine ligase [Elusimicrobia bacterium]|nr:D-alanine--D-alanine ligase [Elusimicrobiota bacterium]